MIEHGEVGGIEYYPYPEQPTRNNGEAIFGLFSEVEDILLLAVWNFTWGVDKYWMRCHLIRETELRKPHSKQ